jgi:hypothetical protein
VKVAKLYPTNVNKSFFDEWTLQIPMETGCDTARGFDCAVLNQDEVRVQHFHDWVAACLDASDRGNTPARTPE